MTKDVVGLFALVAFIATSSPSAYSYRLFSKSTSNDEQNYSKINSSFLPKQTTEQANKQQPNQQILSTGLFHTCAITYRNGVSDSCGGGEKKCGPVKCWGSLSTQPPPGLILTDVSAGGFFTCGLKVGGKAVCWGEINHPPRSLENVEASMSRDELSNFHHAQRMNDAKAGRSSVNGGGSYDQISSGMKHACAVAKDGEVHCWGRNDYGESTPPSGKKFLQVSAGNSFTCGLRPNGAAECWGKNDAYQSSPPPYPENIFKQVSSSIGGDHACGILLGGAVRCWGNNGRGQSEPQDGTFLHVTAGSRTSCGVELKSQLTSIHCWGGRANTLLDQVYFQKTEQRRLAAAKSSSGDLNDGILEERMLFDDTSINYYHQISLGQDHACASTRQVNEYDESSSSSQSIECWWMTGSDFDAHRVPVGLTLVA